jgi:hypothetical protein
MLSYLRLLLVAASCVAFAGALMYWMFERGTSHIDDNEAMSDAEYSRRAQRSGILLPPILIPIFTMQRSGSTESVTNAFEPTERCAMCDDHC